MSDIDYISFFKDQLKKHINAKHVIYMPRTRGKTILSKLFSGDTNKKINGQNSIQIICHDDLRDKP